MRTTVTLDQQLLEKAAKYTGVKERSVLIRLGLESLVQREAARRLARMGGTQPDFVAPPRRRFPPDAE
jgi:Arc/MetJ family transcription regulator